MAWNDELDPSLPAYAIAVDDALRIRVLAGPGTGKSFAMKRRVARVLEEGTDPDRILAVTFTRMAAEDLVREIRGLSVPGAAKVHARTLHSLCFRILASNQVIEITDRHPRTLARFELKPLVADLQAAGLGGKRQISKEIKAYESAWARLQKDRPGRAGDLTDQIFENHLLAWLRFHRAMLIGELVPFAYHYLEDNPLASENEMYDEVLVDEYQDLNKAEQEVVRLLASSGRLVVVGDDDQSIYSFKYAHPAGIQEFGGEDSDLSEHALEECHRSPRLVVEMANRLIARNLDRVDQNRFLKYLPTKGDGRVDVRQFANLAAEADWISAEIEAEVRDGVPVGSIIVLCPDRYLARPLLGRLRKAGIPVRFCFEENELDSAEARNRLAMLGWTSYPNDRVLLRYLVGEKSTSWLSKQWLRVVEICRNEDKGPIEVLDELSAGRSIQRIAKLKERYLEITRESTTLRTLRGVALVDGWLGTSTGSEDDPLADLRRHGRALAESDAALEPAGLYDALVEQITQPEVPDQVDEVRIMSLHKSKGLSANVVAITGLVEGGVPRGTPKDLSEEKADSFMEEQRRLLYVGITRVKADPAEGRLGRLILSSVVNVPTAIAKRSQLKTAADYGGSSSVIASRFLADL